MNKIIYNKNNIIKEYTEGIESHIYYYNNNGNIVFFKCFKNEIQIDKDETILITDDVLENKRKKIEIIKDSSCFSDEVDILDLVYDKDGRFIGYTMKIDSLTTAKDISKRKVKIDILKQLKDKVLKFNENNIYIGDFNHNNILICGDRIKLCDLDNFRIGNLDFDTKSLSQNTYLKKGGKIDNIDNYCYNLFTICYLGNIFNPYVWQYIRMNGLPRILDTKENRKYIDEMLRCKNKEKKYLIDNTRKIIF